MENIKNIIDKVSSNVGFEFSPEIDKILPAFLKFQGSLGFAQKTTENTFFKSKYADLAEVWKVIKDPLTENELGVLQFPAVLDFVQTTIKEKQLRKVGNYDKMVWTGKMLDITVREIMVTTVLYHSSGQFIKSWYSEIPEDNDHHSRGTAITYARRYTLMPILGIAPEDNDGNPAPLEEGSIPRNDNRFNSHQSQTKQPPKQPPKTQASPSPQNQNDYIKDETGRPRYNKKLSKLDDEYQRERRLIETKSWNSLQGMIQQKLGGNILKFQEWLKGVYSCEFYDIQVSFIQGIVQTIENYPDQIMKYAPSNSK